MFAPVKGAHIICRPPPTTAEEMRLLSCAVCGGTGAGESKAPAIPGGIAGQSPETAGDCWRPINPLATIRFAGSPGSGMGQGAGTPTAPQRGPARKAEALIGRRRDRSGHARLGARVGRCALTPGPDRKSLSRIDPRWPGLSRSGQTWPEVARLDPTLPEVARLDPRWPVLTRGGPRWPEVARLEPTWPEVARLDPTLPEVARLDPTWPEVALLDPTRPDAARLDPRWPDLTRRGPRWLDLTRGGLNPTWSGRFLQRHDLGAAACDHCLTAQSAFPWHARLAGLGLCQDRLHPAPFLVHRHPQLPRSAW